MPYIKNEHIEKLIETETYLWKNIGWKDDKEAEKALKDLWDVVEYALGAKSNEKKKSREYMAYKRATDPKYDRRKNK